MNQTVNGLKEGYWEEYNSNGNILSKGNYKSGKLEGYYESYHSNGNVKIQEIYI